MEEQKSAKAGCFVPVDPQFALDYHGNTFSIDGIRIETEDGVNGGLFGNAVTVGKVMIDGCYVGGLIGCVTGNKKLEFQDCYFVGNIDRRGKTEKQDGGPTISRDWPGNTGIMAGNRSMPAVNLAAVRERSPCLIYYLPETKTMRIKRSVSAQTYRGAPTHIRYGRKTGKTRPSITATGSTGKSSSDP